jgi:hypothetical protein
MPLGKGYTVEGQVTGGEVRPLLFLQIALIHSVFLERWRNSN